MSDDALERLIRQKRPKVPPRAHEAPTSQEKLKSKNALTLNNIDVNASLSQDVQTDLPQVVRTTTRIEESIDKSLRHLCTNERVTKEVWFEAAYLYLSQHPEAMNAVNEIARERLSRRKYAADLRKLSTMQKRLSQDTDAKN
ncbi:hypothetical protein NDI49_19595 [Trichocoleus sp. ST-U3]